MKGKVFYKKFHTVSGDIVAREKELRTVPGFDPIEMLCQGWKILEKIQAHGILWITPTERWTALDLTEFMKSNENLVLLRRIGKKFSTGELSINFDDEVGRFLIVRDLF